jgi:hypothetical protein
MAFRVEISLSCCIWIYKPRVTLSFDSNQDITTSFLESTLSREFASSRYFSSLVAWSPAIQAISLSTHSPHSPLVIPTVQHNLSLPQISKIEELYV